MARFEPYCEMRLTNLARGWLENRLSSVHIVMGPLTAYGEADIFNSLIRIISIESGQVVAGSFRWYDSKYLVFRCIYGFLRMLGVMNWEWEIPNEYLDFDLFLYHELLTPFRNHLRVKYPLSLHQPLCIENLWSCSYMKIYPSYHTTPFTAMYPCGDSTEWVDSLLNKDSDFNMDLEPFANVGINSSGE